MLHTFTAEQAAVRETAAAAARKINETIIEIDRQTGHSREWWDAIHLLEREGLLKLHIPKELGGGGHDLFTVVLAEEEIAKVDGGFANIVSHEACSYLIFTNAREAALRDDCLKRMSQGDLTCIAITEPDVGADLARMKTEARRDGDHWVITGDKRVASLAAAAGMYLVFAITDRSKGTKGISAFVIHKGTPGLTVGEPDDLMGYRQLPPADVHLKEVRVPAVQLLGEEGGGLKIFAQALNVGRLGGGTQALGIAQGAFDLALARAKERHTFGKPLIEHQALQFKLAEMQTQIESSRAFVYQVARWMDSVDDISSPEVGRYCAMVKSHCSDMAMKVAIEAVQMFGAYGNYRQYHVERLLRDAKVTQLVDGPNELMKMRIGHALVRNR
ncbi:acyl-CoA dehydrogenase family protein [Ramlibacter sp. AW1]|uniref:Acyl-CoA dehydrogenase family protein n=1 Tax=Ramlibacter aurantiacus TaxID=2801330 RepID=A0A936ZFS7_9BURK|nr:acyl-CoA dehydrogenase family protein [Ramlibacter aurantiacus]MBL0419087.1 acyl-CoA dehydrogenase family protein [Ramlibacter aurantiacus]